jgi:hypothetical protein
LDVRIPENILWKCADSQGSDHCHANLQEQIIQDGLQKARFQAEKVSDPRLRHVAAPDFKRSKSDPAQKLLPRKIYGGGN